MVDLQKEFNFIGFRICRIKTLYSIEDYFTFVNILENTYKDGYDSNVYHARRILHCAKICKEVIQ